MIHFDPTVTIGNLLSIITFAGVFLGIWLRTEKLLATLSVRVKHAEERLDGHDAEHDGHHDQWLRHLTNHKSA